MARIDTTERTIKTMAASDQPQTNHAMEAQKAAGLSARATPARRSVPFRVRCLS